MAGPWEKYAEAPGPWTKYAAPAEPERLVDSIKQGAGNVAAGLVRGAGSIGATLLAPIDMASDALDGKGLSLESNRQRRKDMDGALQSLGAQPDSMLYKAGKIGGEIAGTAGAGGLVAQGVSRVAPGAANLAASIGSGGFNAGTATGATNALTRIAGGTISGGVTAGLTNPEEAGLGAAIGGVLPGAAQAIGATARAGGRLLRGSPVSPEVRALADRAAALGIDIPADRLVDSKPLNALAATLNYVPMSGRAATENRMASQLNQRLSNTFGQDSSNVTMALRKANEALGGEFERVLKNNTVRVDPQFMSELAEAANTASRELGSDGASIIGKQVDDILAKAATGEIDGQAAYNIKKTLDRIGQRNSSEAHYATDLKKALMGALDRSLGPDGAAAFAKTRQQYGSMLDLEKLAKNGAEGEVSVARLANMRNINNPQMQELADIAAQFVKAREGQHGAMQRAVVGGAGAGLAGLPVTLGAMAAGRGANALLNSSVARNAALGTGNPAIENSLAKLLPYGYRSAPVLSAQ
jgi:hypothetical protein